jgi:mono/diheme cytochrome c family protein
MHKTGLALCCALVAGLFVTVPTANAQAAMSALAKRGELLYFRRGCRQCHGINKKMIGPDLAGIQQRRSKDWIYRWLKETDVMLASDSTAMQLAREYNNAHMPKQHLTDSDIDAILAYIGEIEAKGGK